MNIQDNKWQKSETQNHLKNFPGVIGQFLKQTTATQLQQLDKFLPFIFWRWFYLFPDGKIPSPYQNLKILKIIEDWPEKGQFLCIPNLDSGQDNNLNVSVIIDFVEFRDQPLLNDFYNMLNKKSPKYNFGADYMKDLLKLSDLLQDKQFNFLNKDDLILIFETYLTQKLMTWYKEDQFINLGFSQNSWLDFWHNVLRQTLQNEYFDTQYILDPFMDIMNKAIPNYGLKTHQLDKNSGDTPQYLATYIFWVNLNRFLVIPLSLYWNVLAPNFMEPENFYEDVADLIENNYQDPHPLFCPATFISATYFGKIAFAKLEAKLEIFALLKL